MERYRCDLASFDRRLPSFGSIDFNNANDGYGQYGGLVKGRLMAMPHTRSAVREDLYEYLIERMMIAVRLSQNEILERTTTVASPLALRSVEQWLYGNDNLSGSAILPIQPRAQAISNNSSLKTVHR